MPQTEKITLSIAGNPLEVTIQLEDRPELCATAIEGEKGGTYFLTVPQVFIELAEKGRVLCACISPSDCSLVSEDVRREVLLYVVPRIAEMRLPELLDQDELPPFNQRLTFVRLADIQDLRRAKEAIGETYEQRSHMCFTDLCRIVVGIWRDVHAHPKQFDLEVLRASPLKSRIYEDIEWANAIRWGDGENFWHINSDEIIEPCHINGAAMRLLEESLRGASIGVLPEIAGRIDLGTGLNFLDGQFRDSVERDCKEINVGAEAGAAKAVILMCGSVVEALLYDVLKDKETDAKKVAARLAEGPENFSVKDALKRAARSPLNKWSACPIIKVAHELASDIVSADAAAYADVLRDYRNLIHPGKAERSERKVDPHTAAIAISVVNLVIMGFKAKFSGEA